MYNTLNHEVDRAVNGTPSTHTTSETRSFSVKEWVDNLPNEYGDAFTVPLSENTPTIGARTRGQTKRQFSPGISTSRKRRRLEELDMNTPESMGDNGRRKSPRKVSKAPLSSIPPRRAKTPENQEVNSQVDTDATPKSNQDPLSRPDVFRTLPPSDLLSFNARSPNRSSASSSSQNSYKTKSRSTSPSKRIRNLQLSRYPMEWTHFDSSQFPTTLEGLSSLVDDIINIADGDQVISNNVAELAAKHSNTHRIKDRNIDRDVKTRGDNLSDEQFWDRVLEIQSATLECRDEQVSEASWNDEVHSRLLNLALRGHWKSEGIWYRNVTSARIDDSLFLQSMESRMVDYCITLGNCSIFKRRVQEYLRENNLDSINHTSAPGISFTPIAASIETKRGRIDEDDAMHQLATWVSAQFAFLQRLVPPETPLPPLILIMAQAHEWKWMVATSKGVPNTPGVIYRDLHMGETNTVLGICKVVKSLRRIAAYVNEVYRPWFQKEVLEWDRPLK